MTVLSSLELHRPRVRRQCNRCHHLIRGTTVRLFVRDEQGRPRTLWVCEIHKEPT